MHQIIRRFEFDYGHRVLGHLGKCANLHGHRGVAEVSLTCKELDNLGRVIDFGVVKDIIGTWIDDNWDHTMILHEDDPLLTLGRDLGESALGPGITLAYKDWMKEIFGPRKPYILPNSMNPTAENMVVHLKEQLQREFDSYIWVKLDEVGVDDVDVGEEINIKIQQIRFWETPNCSAITYA